jgi:ATP-dependent Lhr-like helicase
MRGASFFADIARATNHLKSEVESALWELTTAGLVTADGFDNLRSLIDAKRRSGQGSARFSRPRNSTGRWTLLFADGGTDKQQQIEATCWMLLNRYGIVFRDILARENLAVSWRELLLVFRRLEDRGEVRGGRFVSGFLGEQFALPIAVDSLRAMRQAPPTGQPITLCAADPLNLIGAIIPGEKVPAVSSKTITLTDGVAQSLQAASMRGVGSQ